MACTGLELPQQEGQGTNRLKVITETNGEALIVSYFACDGEFIPFGAPEIVVSEKSEAEFHLELRSEADKKGHLVRHESTDPQWNPGHVEPDDAVILEEE